MGKRKHKSDEKDIRRKIRRLEDKLRRKEYRDRDFRDQRSDTPSSCSSRSRCYDERLSDAGTKSSVSNGDFMYEDELMLDNIRYSTPQMQSVVQAVQAGVDTAGPTQQSSGPQEVPTNTEVPAQTANTEPINATDPDKPSTSAIPQDILSVLGEAKQSEQPLGESIPNEISERWGKILVDGLAKEQKEALGEKMLIPKNFLLAQAPKLNLEVAAVLPDAAKNRDKRLEKSQNQQGSGIAGLVNLTRDLIQGEIDKLEIIKKISEVSQVLLDLHYEESLNRRRLVVPLLDKKFWNTIQGVKRDTYLFGEKLGENIKNTKDIEKSGQEIKKSFPAQPVFQRRQPPTAAENARPPPRQYNNVRTPAAPSGRYHDAQRPTSARRTNQQGRHRGRPYSTNKHNERRRRY